MLSLTSRPGGGKSRRLVRRAMRTRRAMLTYTHIHDAHDGPMAHGKPCSASWVSIYSCCREDSRCPCNAPGQVHVRTAMPKVELVAPTALLQASYLKRQTSQMHQPDHQTTKHRCINLTTRHPNTYVNFQLFRTPPNT